MSLVVFSIDPLSNQDVHGVLINVSSGISGFLRDRMAAKALLVLCFYSIFIIDFILMFLMFREINIWLAIVTARLAVKA